MPTILNLLMLLTVTPVMQPPAKSEMVWRDYCKTQWEWIQIQNKQEEKKIVEESIPPPGLYQQMYYVQPQSIYRYSYSASCTTGR